MKPRLDTTKYAVIYPRQSSKDQVENNIYSLERQMALREMAVRDGFPEEQVIVVDDDLGLSGRSIENRPGFSRALKLIGQGVVAAIYVEDLTRLSRDERTIDQMVIADACERAGALVYMGRSWYDMRDSGQRQSYKYQAVGASEYWKAHMTKLKDNHRFKAEQGKAAAQPPRGYRVKRDVPKGHPERDKLIIHEPEADVIRAIVARLPDAGSARGLYRAISPAFWPDGTKISFAAFSKLFRSPMYRGTLAWGNVRVPNAHEAIITPDQGAAIDHLLKLNKATKRSPGKQTRAVLIGLVHCPGCNRKIHGGTANGQPLYRCEHITDQREREHHFSVRADHVDRIVMEDLWRRMDAGLIDAIISQLEAREAARAQVVDIGETSRRSLQRKVDGLTKSLADPEASDVVRKVLLQQLDQAVRQLEVFDRQPPPTADIKADLHVYLELRRDREFLAALPGTWEDEPMDWRRSWVRRFIHRVEILRHNKGRCEILVSYLDGQSSRLAYRIKASVQPEEIVAISDLWHHPERPEYGWCKWMVDRLNAQGFDTNPIRVYRVIDRARSAPTSAHGALTVTT